MKRIFIPVLVISILMIAATFVPAESALVERLREHQASWQIENLSVTTIMKAISRQTGINIFVADNINDTITIEMENLSLYDIFQLIMETKKLHFIEKNNMILIEKRTDFEGEQKDFTTAKLCTKFNKAADFLSQLKEMLSEKGTMTVSKRGDCLIVHDRETTIDKIRSILAELDQPIPQVHIEARIVTISQEAIRRLGIKWNYDNLQTSTSVTAASDLSVTNTSNLAFGILQDNLQLNVELQAMQQDNMLKILSAPSILVLDGMEAEIKQGKEVPYVSQSGDILTTSFREANLSLKVIPKVLQDNYIVLDVKVTNDSVDQTTSDSEPLINKQEITTNLFLENSVTVVIGGILLQTGDKQHGGIPGLSRIPLLGHLFKNSEDRDEESELLVFITPTILSMPSTLRERTPVVPEEMDHFDKKNAVDGQ
jgi:type II secretory pathway component HofQ